MNYKIEVYKKSGITDSAGEGIKKDITDLNINTVSKVIVSEIYMICGKLTGKDIEKIGKELLADQVVQDFRFRKISSYQMTADEKAKGSRTIEVGFKLGVMDAVAESAQKGIKDLGIEGVDFVRTAKKIVMEGNISKEELDLIKRRLLVNEIINESITY